MTVRIPGNEDVHRWLQSFQETQAWRDGILIVPERMMATETRRRLILSKLKVEDANIMRMSTPIDELLSESEMETLMDLLCDSKIWGVNFGELQATDNAWRVFAHRLADTYIGFVWINERGKSIGASSRIHDWLLGIGKYTKKGILRGPTSLLAQNRKKKTECDPPPWYDGRNPVFRHPLSRKFLFNPQNSIHFLP